MAILNGWSTGKVVITTDGDVPVTTTILLPMTNYGSGLEEITEFKDNGQELINFDIDNPDIIDEQDFLGHKVNWIFHFEDFITGDDLFEKFQYVLNARKSGWTMVLTPRVDIPNRFFTVNLIDEKLTLMLRRGGQYAQLHKGPLFTFRTKHLEQDLKWQLSPEAGAVFSFTHVNNESIKFVI